jgi:CheY-like chemotaxis protein
MTFTVPLCVPEPAEAAAAAAAAAALPPQQTEEERDISRLLGSPEVLEPPAAHSPHSTLPPSPASSAAASPPGSPSLLPMAGARSATAAAAAADVSILVAEDDALSQAVMRKVLARLGLRCTLVGDGAAAVEAYRTGAARIDDPMTRDTAQSTCTHALTHLFTSSCAAGCFDVVLMDLHSACPQLACRRRTFFADAVASVCVRGVLASVPLLLRYKVPSWTA